MKILKIFKIENFDSRFKLIVADRDQNFGGHSKYRSRAFQQKKIEVIRPRKRCVKLLQSRSILATS